MTQKLYIQTNGCQMNEYDSDKMRDVLQASHGFELIDDPKLADVLLLNTCSIREKAQEKVFSALGKWRKIKDKRPDVIIGVGGCVASQEGAAIQKRAPFVDMVFGPQTLHRLPQLLDQVRSKHTPVVDISFPEIEKFDALPEPRAEGSKAFVSVMEGCSKYCSFCVVPYTRGEEISRPLKDIVIEITSLAKQGVREINLLGQNVNAYRGVMEDGDIADFALLLHYVAAIDGIDRLRFTTSHPVEFTDSLIEAFAEIPQLVDHLHLPVQSGSTRVLQLMNRTYTREWYLSKVARIKEIMPTCTVSSDIIAGFCTETEQDHQDTISIMQAAQYDYSYMYFYSERPGTLAAKRYEDDIPEEIKKRRLQEIVDVQWTLSNESNKRDVGKSFEVLIEGDSKKSDAEWMGRTSQNKVVVFPKLNHPIKKGDYVEIFITGFTKGTLLGTLKTN